MGYQVSDREPGQKLFIAQKVVKLIAKKQGYMVDESPAFHCGLALQITFILIHQVLQEVESLFDVRALFIQAVYLLRRKIEVGLQSDGAELELFIKQAAVCIVLNLLFDPDTNMRLTCR